MLLLLNCCLGLSCSSNIVDQYGESSAPCAALVCLFTGLSALCGMAVRATVFSRNFWLSRARFFGFGVSQFRCLAVVGESIMNRGADTWKVDISNL